MWPAIRRCGASLPDRRDIRGAAGGVQTARSRQANWVNREELPGEDLFLRNCSTPGSIAECKIHETHQIRRLTNAVGLSSADVRDQEARDVNG
jgi:hypothetical protein